jgi:hypothetical protein
MATLAELSETDATGDLARIYDEIRVFSAVPYVSSLQRHMATMPGCLEYCWGVCRPAFMDGTIQQAAWRRAAAAASHEPFGALSHAAMRLLGVDGAGVRAIRMICETFIRVSPINLLFAGCIEHLITGGRPGGRAAPRVVWTPPEMLDAAAPMPPLDTLPEDLRAVLMGLAMDLGGARFVPGLYRQIAQWPAYLAHVATLVAPLLGDDGARARRADIARAVIDGAAGIVATLPPPPELTPPGDAQCKALLGAIKAYRVTSPEMIVFGTLLRDALPGNTPDEQET